MKTIRCPKCGKMIAIRFPIHDCKPLGKPKGKTLVEILLPNPAKRYLRRVNPLQ